MQESPPPKHYNSQHALPQQAACPQAPFCMLGAVVPAPQPPPPNIPMHPNIPNGHPTSSWGPPPLTPPAPPTIPLLIPFPTTGLELGSCACREMGVHIILFFFWGGEWGALTSTLPAGCRWLATVTPSHMSSMMYLSGSPGRGKFSVKKKVGDPPYPPGAGEALGGVPGWFWGAHALLSSMSSRWQSLVEAERGQA